MIKPLILIIVGACISLLVQLGFTAIAFSFNPNPSGSFQGMVVVIEFVVWLLTGVVIYDIIVGSRLTNRCQKETDHNRPTYRIESSTIESIKEEEE